MEASKMSMKINLSLFTLLIISFICTGCGPNKHFGLDESGLEELKRLCEQDAGLTINKRVKADGYYDATRKGGVLWKLIPSDFDFVEYCNLEPNIMSLFVEPGCWRLIKISRETGQCNASVDKSLMRVGSETSIKYRKQNCIAVEKIEKPTARYSYHSEPRAWLDKNGTSEFRRSDSYIEDTMTSEVMGRYVSYSYNVRPRHSSPKSCHVIDDKYISYAEANLVESIIKSGK